MEHLHDSLGSVREHMEAMPTRTFIFSTRLFDDTGAPKATWAYYSFPTGQHIPLYQRPTLDHMARALGVRCYSSGLLHMLTDRQTSSLAFRMLAS